MSYFSLGSFSKRHPSSHTWLSSRPIGLSSASFWTLRIPSRPNSYPPLSVFCIASRFVGLSSRSPLGNVYNRVARYLLSHRQCRIRVPFAPFHLSIRLIASRFRAIRSSGYPFAWSQYNPLAPHACLACVILSARHPSPMDL